MRLLRLSAAVGVAAAIVTVGAAGSAAATSRTTSGAGGNPNATYVPAGVAMHTTNAGATGVASSPTGTFDGVSCPSSSLCMAIGDGPSYDADLAYGLLGATWNGRVWTQIQVPNPDGQYHLQDVSCTSPTFCMAVGTDDGYQGNYGPGEGAAAMSWNGESWTALQVPTPDDFEIEGMELTSVSCTSADYCLAVGSDSGEDIDDPQPPYSAPWLETWNGMQWSLSYPPEPASVSSESLLGVSCATSGFCLVVGDNESGPSVYASIDGKIRLLANPAGTADFDLDGVSCVSASFCVLVGSDPEGSVGEVWNGQRLAVMPGAAGSKPGANLSAVACVSASQCVAIGSPSESWNGKSWSAVTVAEPAGSADTVLSDMSCGSSAACQAVGFWSPNTKDDPSFGLVESWDGKTWSVEVPQPVVGIASTPDGKGYWVTDSTGSVTSSGDAPRYQSLAARGVAVDDIVGIAPDPKATGFWLVGADGSVYPFGSATFHGSLPGLGVKVSDIEGIAPTSDGTGYWLVGADGGEFAFGDATYHGSLPGIGVKVHGVVGMVASPTGRGYLMVGSDGGVFAFGMRFFGSLPGLGVKVSDIVGVLPTVDGAGYVLAGADGGAFVFGHGSGFYGSLPGRGIHVDDVTGLALTPDDHGYWMVGSDGTVYGFGDAEVYAQL
jgi:hypothetical protein